MKKEYRVRRNEEFTSILSKKHSQACGSFVVYCDARKGEHARAGVSVSKKLGGAVERNRIKRQVREMIYSLVDFENCPKDLIVIVRMGYLGHDFSYNKKELEKLFKKAII